MIRLVLKSSWEVGQVCSNTAHPRSARPSLSAISKRLKIAEWVGRRIGGAPKTTREHLKGYTWLLRGHVMGLCGFTASLWISSLQHATPPSRWTSTNHFNHLPHSTRGTNPIHQVGRIMCFFPFSLQYVRGLFYAFCTWWLKSHGAPEQHCGLPPIQVDSWNVVQDEWAAKRPSLPVKRS